MCLINHLCHPRCEVVQGFQLGFSDRFESKPGVLTGIEHKWGGLCQGVNENPVIVGELSNRDPFVPVILSLIDKESEELLNFLIDPFGLAICLWVVGGRL